VGINPVSLVTIEVPELVVIARTAVETIKPGQTAVFFLSEAKYKQGTRLCLLAVRLTPAK
jgi:hypothetical protein